MATHTTIDLTPGVWTLLNTGGAALGAVSLYPLDLPVLIQGTISATPPTDFVSAHLLPPAPGAIINTTLSSLWPGIVAKHVYGFSAAGGKVVVSCA